MNYERELELAADRLRHLPAVRLAPAEQRFYVLLDTMTQRPVPRLRSLAWGDQLWVLGRDVVQEDRERLIEPLRQLRRSFDPTL